MTLEANPATEATPAEAEASILERISSAIGEPQEQPPQEAEEIEAESEDIEVSDQSDYEASDEEPEQESEAPETSYFTVKVNGEDLQVSQEDLISGYSKGADYTRKTTELAEQRKAFEAERTKKFQALDQQIENLDAVIKASEEKINWDEIRELDPSEYLRLKEQQSHRRETAEKAKAEKQKLIKQEKDIHIQQESAALFNARPEWKDDAKRTEALTKINDYAKSLGFSDSEIDDITDHKHFLVLHDAALYRDMMAKSKAVKKEIKKAPKTIKPRQGASRKSTNDDALARFKKTKSEADALAVFRDRYS